LLWAAAQGGNTHDCAALIEIGADINWKNQDGETALIAACKRGHVETIGLLLAHGADANLTGKDSFAPIHITARRGDANSLDLLLDANTNTLVKTRNGQTALDIAKEKGHETIYSRIMRQRSSLNRNPSSSNPLPTPVRTGNTETVNTPAAARPDLPAVLLPPNRTVQSSSSRRASPADAKDAKEIDKVVTTPNSSGRNMSEKKNSQTAKDEVNVQSGKNSYTIMGQSSNAGEDQSIALKKLLDAEKVAKNILEAKVGSLIYESHNRIFISS
jgi:hypothetical protein